MIGDETVEDCLNDTDMEDWKKIITFLLINKT